MSCLHMQVRLWVPVDATSTKRGWFGSKPSKVNPADQGPKKLEIRDVVVFLNPFPSGSFTELCLRFVQLVMWLGWAGFLGIFLALQVTEVNKEDLINALQKGQGQGSARFKFASFMSTKHFTWVLPALVHVVVVWGGGVWRQRNGYIARNLWQSLHAFPAHMYAFCRRRPGPPAHQGAYARCSSDPQIDARFFPASNLRIDPARSWANFCMWVLVILIKVAFELLLVIVPLVKMMRSVSRPAGYQRDCQVCAHARCNIAG